MNEAERTRKIEEWNAVEAAMRARLAAPGSTSIEQLLELAPTDYLAGIGSGDFPSPAIGDLIGFYPIEWSEGCFVFQGTPGKRHYNPLGSVHGGYAATLLDSAMGCAVHTGLKKGQAYTTVDLRISYVRALTSDTGPVRAEGTIVHIGRTIALAEGRIYDVDDRLYATGTTTCMILGPRG
ncbi:PaaI family thioesterase [Pseudomonas sp. UBA6310]|uniref:PaaI family thioesterase n=1 Tax=Pseudomonas sp. UBA6310 TaxID=1947327 RepID=UPI002579D2F8|nr:PaaI family thioesterase [Pseudomonas sp. UBA6310]